MRLFKFILVIIGSNVAVAQIGGGNNNFDSGNGFGNGWNNNNGRGNGMGNGGRNGNDGTVIIGGSGMSSSGWNSNGGNVFVNGASVSTNCNNNVCNTCINNKCYNRGYNNVMTYEKCPVTACEKDCLELVWNTDNCPICRCNGFSTREPCSSDSDCGSSKGKCTDNLCRYPAVPDNLPKVCTFAHNCPETDNCSKQKCEKDSANRRHVVNRSCVFVNQCPSGYNCEGMTCWEGGPAHTSDSCVFDYQCPTKYSCQQMSCIYTGKEHGTLSCVSNDQCQSGESCINMTCQ